ncbi:hypothetical protein F5887DRAFT_914504 [Amanita rubescens]|nr:hypothetical protein F5887DRAFT_914504 [Amanita rubescens]
MYPIFLRFLKLYASSGLKKSSTGSDRGNQIRILQTQMSFSVSRDDGALIEWASENFSTVFCQSRRLLDSQMWSMIYDVFRFNSCAPKILLNNDSSSMDEISVGEYLQKEGYSATFRDNYLVYASLTGAKDDRKDHGKVILTTADGQFEIYDHVIVACHSDGAIKILEAGGDLGVDGGITRDVLGMFEWSRNEVTLRSDPKPRMLIKSLFDGEKMQNFISFAGAYLKYGFHEDAFTSGLLAACSLDPCTALDIEKYLDHFSAAPAPPQIR